MTADDVSRLLIELISRLPPDMRPFVGSMLGNAAASQPYWTPVAIALLVVVAMGSLYVYVEALDD
jgi:hypothetical protein